MIKYATIGTAVAALAGCVSVDVDDTNFATNVSHYGGMTVGGSYD